MGVKPFIYLLNLGNGKIIAFFDVFLKKAFDSFG